MRLKKTRVVAAGLCLAIAVSLSGCGGGGGSTGGGNTPSPTPGSSSENPAPADPDAPGNSGDKKDDSDSDDSTQSLYEPVSQAKMASSFSGDYEFFIDVDFSTGTGESGRFVKFRGPYSYYTKGDSLTPYLFRICVDKIPEDYLRGDDRIVSNYVWDSVGKQFLHVKNSSGNRPIDSSKWKYRNGYKYICAIGQGNKIYPFSDSIYSSGNLKDFDGWCKEADVDNFLSSLDLQTFQSLVTLDGCPFQENLKATENSDISGYYLYNGRVYFER